MKRVLLTALKVIGVMILAALVFFMIYGIIFVLRWPWWVGLIAFMGAVGLAFTALLVKKLWGRRREKHFVQQIIAQDEARLQSLEHSDKERSKDLQAKWKEAIAALRSSHLKGLGNPLYVLPWYLIIGESGAGKTTAIRSARLSSPFTEVSRISGIAGTKNCDWWFFEQAVLIDTAGRYAIPVDDGRDKKEWQEFLRLLARYRRKEPLNGLIVAVAADKLLTADGSELEADGVSIRRRIDELMRSLGAKFPVYVMVTKCDLVQGMNLLCQHLPEEALNQAMGYLNEDLSTDVDRFCVEAVDTVADRLRELRLILLHEQGGTKNVDPALLLFPDEFTRIRKGLRSFLKGAFQENPYQETPLLRGLHFSSGRQEGTPYSHFLNSLGLLDAKEILPGTDRGLFLHDFFAKILPADRRLFAPTQRMIRWRQLTTNLALVAWVTLGLFACGLLTYSFYDNSRMLGELKGRVPVELTRADAGHVAPTQLAAVLAQTAKAVEDLERRNRQRLLPRLGLDQGLRAERELKRRFCRLFETGLLAVLNANMLKSVDQLAFSGSPTLVLQHVTHLAERISILDDRVNGAVAGILKDEGLEGQPEALRRLAAHGQPTYWPGLPRLANRKDYERLKNQVSALYLRFLAWTDSTAAVQKERRTVLGALERILDAQGSGLSWLVSWVNESSALQPITLATFWGGALGSGRGPMIAPAYTRDGKAIIDDFIGRLERSVPASKRFADARNRFYGRYFLEYVNAWRAFADQFAEGALLVRSRQQARTVALRICRGEGPFAAFMRRMISEIKAVPFTEPLPEWVRLLKQFDIIVQHARSTPAPKADAKPGLAQAVADKLKKGREQLQGLAGKTSAWDAAQGLTPTLAPLVPVYRSYRQSLRLLGPVAQSSRAAFEITYKTFAEESALGGSPFYAAFEAVDRLRAGLLTTDPSSEAFWKLVRGPVLFCWQYALRETSCFLQERWEQTVLAEATAVSGWDREQLLLGKGGLVWGYVEKWAAPFILRNPVTGYRRKGVLQGMIPFSPEFLAFLTKGTTGKQALTMKKRYTVSIEARPTGTNAGARLHPRLTRLVLHCGQEQQVLKNFQFRVKRSFVWTPGQCADVVLEIYVGDLVLKKFYTGQQAFVDFLRDFPGGEHTFRADDFPQQEQALERFGIKRIKVAYVFHGHRDLLKKVTEVPQEAPKTICPCWK